MTTSNEDQNRRDAQDEILVEALASGCAYVKAADLAGVTSRTVVRRMATVAFTRRVSERRAERVAEVTGQLVSASTDAVRVLHEHCLGAERPADQLRAASLLLTLGLKFRHEHDLEARLQEVEARLGLAEAGEADAVEERI